MAGDALMDEAQRLTVAYLDALRRDALRAGLSPLKQYDQITSRVRLAAATAVSVEEWATTVARGLQVQSLSSSTSSALRDLTASVTEASGGWRLPIGRSVARWLDMIERETGYLIALLRQAAEQRRALHDELRALDADAHDGQPGLDFDDDEVPE